MRPNIRMSNALRTSTLVAASLVAMASTATAQRNINDPSRFYREHPMKTTAKGKSTTPSYNLFLTPTFGWTDNFQQFGGQLKYASDDLISNIPVSFSGSLMQNRFTAPGLPSVSKLSEN